MAPFQGIADSPEITCAGLCGAPSTDPVFRLPARAPDGESMFRTRDRFCAWLFSRNGPGPRSSSFVMEVGSLFSQRAGGDVPTPGEWDRVTSSFMDYFSDERSDQWSELAGLAAHHCWNSWSRSISQQDYRARAAAGLVALIGDRIVIPMLDTRLSLRLGNGAARLEMGDWHTCETTHCRAGWYVIEAGEVGRELELHFGPWLAGAAIYLASHPEETEVPRFFVSNDEAWRSIVESASRESESP
jgi:hypothetical protein